MSSMCVACSCGAAGPWASHPLPLPATLTPTNPPTQQLTQQPIHPSIHPSIHPPNHPSTYPSAQPFVPVAGDWHACRHTQTPTPLPSPSPCLCSLRGQVPDAAVGAQPHRADSPRPQVGAVPCGAAEGLGPGSQGQRSRRAGHVQPCRAPAAVVHGCARRAMACREELARVHDVVWPRAAQSPGRGAAALLALQLRMLPARTLADAEGQRPCW
eukprot:347701-Chlamydomonas_euryale.AAC.19